MEKIKMFLVKFSISFIMAIFFLETVKRLMIKADRYIFYKIVIIVGIALGCVMTIALVLHDKKNNQEKTKLAQVLFEFTKIFIACVVLVGIILSPFAFSRKEELIMCVSFVKDFDALMIISGLIYICMIKSD